MENKKLELKGVFANSGTKEILKGVDIEVQKGEVCVIMGPNGAGKSTISNVIMGHPKYEVSKGSILLNGSDITQLEADERAKKGLFMAFQQPIEISGITMANFLRTSYNMVKGESLNLVKFHKLLKEKMAQLEMDDSFKSRFLNTGFSGGEKKRSEILQLLLFEPEFAILDEIDSGLDVDAMKIISKALSEIKDKLDMGIIIITHHARILEYLKADKVYIVKEGKVAEIGDDSLISRIEKQGFK